jgi:hypothetical protein
VEYTGTAYSQILNKPPLDIWDPQVVYEEAEKGLLEQDGVLIITCISAILVTMFEPHFNTCNKNTKTHILQSNFVIKTSCFFYLKKLIMSIIQNSFVKPVSIAIGFTTHK